VGQLNEPAASFLMGVYARRYALVGIAGDDDLDAPDLNLQPAPEGDGSHASALESLLGTVLGTAMASMAPGHRAFS